MTERERLIEIMQKFDTMSISSDGFIASYADYLLENGVTISAVETADNANGGEDNA